MEIMKQNAYSDRLIDFAIFHSGKMCDKDATGDFEIFQLISHTSSFLFELKNNTLALTLFTIPLAILSNTVQTIIT